MNLQPKHGVALAIVALLFAFFGMVTFSQAVSDALEDDHVFLGSANDIAVPTQLDDCDATSSHKLQYDADTNTFPCDTTAPGSSITTQEDNAADQTVSQIDWSTGIDRTHVAGEDTITIDPTEFGAAWLDALTDIDASLLSGADATLITGTAGTTGNCVEWDANGDAVDSGAACGGGGSGDAITVNTSAIDTTADFTDGDIDWTIVDGGAGGPDDITATVDCTDCVTLATETTGAYVATATGGAGIAVSGVGAENATLAIATASGETGFLASGALTCGAGTAGAAQVHTTPLQYCDNAATPALQYAAYGNSSGESTAAGADSVALATDTTGNYVATIADSGSSTITVANSGTEDAAVTLQVVDVSCTDCLGVTEIADVYLLDDGDSGTGDYDFGAATSFAIPNGTAPTVNAAGEIAEDTTASQLIYGASANVLSPVMDAQFTIESPSDADNILLGKWAAYGVTITDIFCIVDPADTGESVVIDIQERDATGDTPVSVDATITCDNDGAEDDGALTNGAIDAGDWWSIDIGTVTGTVGQLSVTVLYTITRE